ncbi:NAD-dependent epimerase/dehydratase family protein [Aeromonas simiae]|uniref:NAD-dependent epimerase/dehydratase family protein n=1 Tax=Aeromonas simiae TaxID=218936 RepID=UPI0005A5F639|nr:NAD-dependent epimerase/dehydratase family protein [Aeromonas simiae]MDO2949801.1 NAD-dependent epimerase/dehydratase family protein [Aeromonas simiae]MDO2950996.1 NAD-dependent epimerase/dehydratase family protein [Aeromonas simiae]MDO2957111.1 NAD-dependent epimerase/dehydratase family protein [Aeromonas simiae]
MSHILIGGATGLVGRVLVQQLAPNNDLWLPCRRAGTARNGHHWLVTDFAHLTDLNLPVPIDTAFCALGTTRREAGSAEAFRRVDLDYVLSFAELARRHGCRRLVVISSLGANPHSLFLYPRTKGEMEQALLAQTWERLAIVRPAMLLGQRQPPRRSEQITQRLYPLLAPLLRGPLTRWRAIEATQVAHAMVQLAVGVGNDIVENERLLVL